MTRCALCGCEMQFHKDIVWVDMEGNMYKNINGVDDYCHRTVLGKYGFDTG